MDRHCYIWPDNCYITHTMEDLTSLVAQLRASGGDNSAIEVKSAAGGLPQSLTETLSALANLPGGGLIILGLDEATSFTPVALDDRQALKQGLASKARTFIPPVRLSIEDATVEGSTVVVARVAECDVSAKPCRVAATGRAYLRSYDGDYELSSVEEQAFLAERRAPRSDRVPVAGSRAEDLDRALLAEWLRTVRERDPAGLGRFRDDSEILRRGGVIASNGEITVAGLLALGIHPQQWFPRQVIQLASRPAGLSTNGVRATHAVTLSGPIPTMLAGALSWARSVFAPSVVGAADGSVRDRFAYPLEAFRELISNALVHRDLADWSAGLAVEVRHLPDRVIITNPGGLYGITVDRLGSEAVTSARNAQLLTICQYVRLPDDGTRVVEALATGIPIVTAALRAAGLPNAQYIDAGIRFTVILRRHGAPAAVATVRGHTTGRIWDALRSGDRTVEQLSAVTGLGAANIRRVLRVLRSQGLVEQLGGPGQVTTYRRTAE